MFQSWLDRKNSLIATLEMKMTSILVKMQSLAIGLSETLVQPGFKAEFFLWCGWYGIIGSVQPYCHGIVPGKKVDYSLTWVIELLD